MSTDFHWRKALLIPALLMSAPALTLASTQAEIGVSGKIKPTAAQCRIDTLPEVAYGVLPLEKIHTDDVTLLDAKRISVSVRCNEPAKFMVRFIDTQHASAVNDARFLAKASQIRPDIQPDEAFSLGTDSTGQKIGAVFLKIGSIFSSGGNGGDETLLRQHNGQWVRNADGRLHHQTGNAVASVMTCPAAGSTPTPRSTPCGTPPLDALQPGYFTDLSLVVNVDPVLDSEHLDLTKHIGIKGKITVELSQI